MDGTAVQGMARPMFWGMMVNPPSPMPRGGLRLGVTICQSEKWRGHSHARVQRVAENPLRITTHNAQYHNSPRGGAGPDGSKGCIQGRKRGIPPCGTTLPTDSRPPQLLSLRPGTKNGGNAATASDVVWPSRCLRTASGQCARTRTV